MRALTVDIPLGPFDGADVEVYIGGKSKTARIHADRSCLPVTRHIIMPLNTETIGRMCRQCGRTARWARPNSALGMFLQAITSMPDESPGSIQEDYPAAECARAAELLQNGEYPPDEDEDDDDLWNEYGSARELRDSLYSSWRYARREARNAHAVVAAYPWLRSWAAPILAIADSEAELLRNLISQTIAPDRLMIATAALSLPQPDLPAERPEFAILGSPHHVLRILGKCWHRWRDAAAHGRSTDDMARAAELALDSALGRKRKGRDAAISTLTELIDGWTKQADAAAEHHISAPHRNVVIQATKPRQADQDPWDAATAWELAVIARYGTRFSWTHDAALLTVPDVIARHLLGDRHGLQADELDTADSLAGFIQWESARPSVSTGILPGILDDTTIGKRRTLTSGDVDRLRRSGAEIFQVYSPAGGTEVLTIGALAKRCAQGWRGAIMAGPDDLPADLIAAWMNDLEGSLNDDVDPLSTQAGEHTVIQRRYRSDREAVERRLRLLALVRTVADLRTLTDGYEPPDRDIEWLGLLTPHPLDLRPFEPPADDRRMRGLGLPLGVLASVQIYTTDGSGRYIGKGHSPFCSFARSGRTTLDDRFDLLHLQDLVGPLNPDWCSVCGGYAARRLDDAQLRYYRTAHELLELGDRLDGWGRWPRSRSEELTEIRPKLESLANIDPDNCGSLCMASTKWRSTIDSLLADTDETVSER
ncbi:hypothetical protein [Amycolatopsis sp. lyj-84]|uniref:hypothetical protein n=1 Tax=Amycolatopsis sp. lyj-84 TaxID=2789284 RepID=UPI00397BE93D